MLRSYGSKKTEKIWEGVRSSKIPPSNRLEKLSGNLKEYYSIRINDRWRIIFKWQGGHAYEVEVIDYHK